MIAPIPYKGDRPYIFISYAHKDSHLVWPIVQQMQNDGYRVWYDEGIDPGTEWDENIARHVADCDYFIAFLSKNYLASENCKDELNYGRDLGKHQLLVYLQPVRLPQGIALRIGRCESVKTDQSGRFYRKVYAAEGISAFTDKPAQLFRKKSAALPIGAIAGAVLVAALLLFNQKPASPPEETTAAATEETTQPSEELVFRKTVMLQSEKLTVTAQDMTVNEQGDLVLELLVENSMDWDCWLDFSPFSINSVAVHAPVVQEFLPGSTQTGVVYWPREDLVAAGLEYIRKPEDVRRMEGMIHAGGNMSEMDPVCYYPYGREYGQQEPFQPEEDDVLLLQTQQLRLYATNHAYEENGDWMAELVCVNTTSRTVDSSVYLRNINGYQMGPSTRFLLQEGSWCRSRVRVENWQLTGYPRVELAGGTVFSQDRKSHDSEEASFSYYPEGNTAFVPAERQSQPEDTVVLETSSLRITLVGTRKQERYRAAVLYIQNLSDTKLRLSLEDCCLNNQKVGELGLSHYNQLDPGAQDVRLAYWYSDEDDSKVTLTATAVAVDMYGKERLREPVRMNLRFD